MHCHRYNCFALSLFWVCSENKVSSSLLPLSSHLYDHAEERRRSAHGQLLLLEQRNGRLLHGALGEQDDVLHRVGVWAVDLRIIAIFFIYVLVCLCGWNDKNIWYTEKHTQTQAERSDTPTQRHSKLTIVKRYHHYLYIFQQKTEKKTNKNFQLNIVFNFKSYWRYRPFVFLKSLAISDTPNEINRVCYELNS